MSVPRVVAFIGAYRKVGIIEQAVDSVLQSAEESGAKTRKIHLIDHPIEFCRNCRLCTQRPGEDRGECVKDDDMSPMLDEMEAADAIVLAAPVNVGDVTAITRRFMERMTCCTYWPWDRSTPEPRIKTSTKKALLITSTTMPGLVARFFSRSTRTLREIARLAGAQPVGEFFVAQPARLIDERLGRKERRTAMDYGRRLVQPGNRS